MELRTGRPADAALAARRPRRHWHEPDRSGALRAAVFGANDGLVSNVSLVMGIAGAGAGSRVILLGGIAGLLAGAFSMAAGEYLSVRTQAERFALHLAVERRELVDDPDEERAELAWIYESKGVPREHAELVATHLMSRPEVALDTMAREELGFAPDELGSPWKAAGSSFVTFSVGALVPVLPYLLGAEGSAALAASALLGALALLAVGAFLGGLTGRGRTRSALRMFAIGASAALVTYAVGSLIGVGTQA